MARNGSGTYNPPTNSWSPAVSGVSATAADWQAILNDLSSALSQSISADGQTPITGNLAMGGNRLTGLAAGVATGQSLRWEQLFSQGVEVDVSSAATTNIGLENSNFLRITGTTTITSFGTSYNGPRFIRFADVLTLTHNASTLILPTAANITTAAGDRAIVVPKATAGTSDGWQVIAYQRASGAALVVNVSSVTGTLPVANGGTGATSEAAAIAGLFGTRVDVASAATVDLSSIVSSINITGTTTITAFTIAIGRLVFVRFNASLTLTNNASIVTQSGANIVTAAGDTCILRATAANVVEVLSYTRGIPAALGDGQTWQTVTGSRSIGATYTNTTGRAIAVHIAFSNPGAPQGFGMTATVAGVALVYGFYALGGVYGHMDFVVPPGATYTITGAASLSSWVELR